MTPQTDKTRQAQLKQEYKTDKPPMGIYLIRNTVSGKLLLDASRNIPGAINRHRFELRQGAHRNKSLMADWKRLGEAAFAFETVDLVKPQQDPAYDYDAELAILLEIWREKHPSGADESYH